MTRPYLELFPALRLGQIPVGPGGFIFEGRFHDRSDYSIFTITAFPELRRIYSRPDRGGVDLRADGHAIVVTYEPAGFHDSFKEPYLRDRKAKIPFRFNDLNVIELSRKDKLLVSKEPHPSLGMIMVELPERGEFVYYFQDHGEVTERQVHLMLMSLFQKTYGVKTKYLDRLTDLFRENLRQYRGNFGRFAGGKGFHPNRRPVRPGPPVE
jgi:DNA helicase HerA-like ATPase